MKIAILGGTGKEGSGLALRWAKTQEVVIGSRQLEKIDHRCAELNRILGKNPIQGATNLEAARDADASMRTVPYHSHDEILIEVKDVVAGKVLIDATAPLDAEHIDWVRTARKSAAEEAQDLLGKTIFVVAAFQTVSCHLLHDLNHRPDCDVLVCSDWDEAKSEAIRLAQICGFRALDAGPLRNTRALEAMTPVLLHIDKTYHVKNAGIHVTGLDHAKEV